MDELIDDYERYLLIDQGKSQNTIQKLHERFEEVCYIY